MKGVQAALNPVVPSPSLADLSKGVKGIFKYFWNVFQVKKGLACTLLCFLHA